MGARRRCLAGLMAAHAQAVGLSQNDRKGLLTFSPTFSPGRGSPPPHRSMLPEEGGELVDVGVHGEGAGDYAARVHLLAHHLQGAKGLRMVVAQ